MSHKKPVIPEKYAKQMGVRAADEGKPDSSCPYVSDEMRSAWNSGWASRMDWLATHPKKE